MAICSSFVFGLYLDGENPEPTTFYSDKFLPVFVVMVLDTRISERPAPLSEIREFMSRSVYFAKFRRRDFLRFADQYKNNFRGLHLPHELDELQSQSSGHGSLPPNGNFSLFQVCKSAFCFSRLV